MNDPKLYAYGQWLTERVTQYRADLFSVCGNDKMTIETVKRKYGQMEAFIESLKAFTELYEGDLDSFKANFLDIKEESNEPEQSNG